MISLDTINKIINGEKHDIPVLCVVKDVEQLALRDPDEDNVSVKWKVIDYIKDSGVTVVPCDTALSLIKAMGLVPALRVKGQGVVYDTPARDFRNKFLGEGNKVYITI